MQNIDPLYFLIPAVVLALGVGTVLHWHDRRRLISWALLRSFAAGIGAIVVKERVQPATFRPIETAVGGNPAHLGVRSWYIDAEGFGIGLGFWEHAVVFALPALFDHLVYYVLLSQAGSASAHNLHATLPQNAPAPFYGSPATLPC